MSTNLSTAFVTLFSERVKQAYQAESKLRNSVRLRTGVVGSTAKFPKVGKGTAAVRTPQTDVVPLNSSFTTSTATIVDYSAAEYTDIFNQQKVNFSEREELVQVCAKAIGRRIDQSIIDAVDGAGTSLTVANSLGGANTNMNTTKLREAKKKLDGKNVPPDDRYMLMHANNMAALLGETAAVSFDFNALRALEAGMIPKYLGFNIIVIGDMDEDGLAIDGSSDRTCLAWHKDAIALAEGIGARTEINYVAEKTSWLVNAISAHGATSVDVEGIVEVTCRDTAAAAA